MWLRHMILMRTFLSRGHNSSQSNKAEEKLLVDYYTLLELLKEKLPTVNNREKIQILTLVPDSWSRAYASSYFNVSEYLVRQARELKKQEGNPFNPTS